MKYKKLRLAINLLPNIFLISSVDLFLKIIPQDIFIFLRLVETKTLMV